MKLLLSEMREPFGLMLAGTTAAAGLVLGLPLVVAILAAVIVFAVKLSAAAVIEQAKAPRIALGSAELEWMERAQRAVAAFRQLAHSSRSEPIGARCLAIGIQAHATLELLWRLAGQASTVGQMLQSIDASRLTSEDSRLWEERGAAESDQARREIELSQGLIREQLAARRRVEQGKAALMARLQSGVLALEGLVTRLAEVVALGQTATGSDDAGDRVAELADELEGLRAGLSELERANARRWEGAELNENQIPKIKEE